MRPESLGTLARSPHRMTCILIHYQPVQVHIAEAGAVPLLVALLRSPKDATRKAAASGE